jgi:hypothetical protein
MRTSELSGAALDWAVAMAEGWQHITAQDNGGEYPWLAKHGKYQDPKHYRPTSNWMQGGPIIEREGLAISRVAQDEWSASLIHEDKEYGGVMYTNEHGTTPLIAAMRCYVASKLGDEVQLPEGLNP